MSTGFERDVEIAIVGAGVVGCAVALALARRGVAVGVLEAEPEPGLAASGTNSGVLHAAFDSAPGELETELILAAVAIRDRLLDALQIPVLRCGALVCPQTDSDRAATAHLATLARDNGVDFIRHPDGLLEIPGEAVTDPVRYTLALASAARSHGAELLMRHPVAALEASGEGVTVRTAGGSPVRCSVVVNCAGLYADAIARMAGDDSFAIYPRKGEFLVFDPPDGAPLDRILLPIPTERTKGVLVFPTVDGKVIAGPTAVDQEDKRDWSVRPDAAAEILPKARTMYPALEGAEPIAAYAGLRPAGRGVNYLIGRSRACPRLVNVAAIRSTGLTASLGIADRVSAIVASLGVGLAPAGELKPGTVPATTEPWWARTAKYRRAVTAGPA